jgi:hypothetical protein
VAEQQPAARPSASRGEQRRGRAPRARSRIRRRRRASAAGHYGLAILASNIEDEPNNTTRFLVLGDYAAEGPRDRDKTSLVLSARNRAGAVYEMLTPFATRGVSMTKFESRPVARGALGIPLLRRHRGPSRRPAGRRGAREGGRIAGYIKVLGSIRWRSCERGRGEPEGEDERARTCQRALDRTVRARKPISETARELGIPESRILKMASNENPLGPSPAALEAIRGALADLNYYPDGSGYELKGVLSRMLPVAPANIVLGNGSNDVLELAARAFLRPSESAVYSRHAFMVYPLVVQAIGATAIEVPARDYGNDLEALAAAVRRDTKMVFIANPNNPTGTFSPGRRSSASSRACRQRAGGARRGLRRVPPDELASRPTPSWLARFPNLIVSRTLSKAYGLAGCAWVTASRIPTSPR